MPFLDKRLINFAKKNPGSPLLFIDGKNSLKKLPEAPDAPTLATTRLKFLFLAAATMGQAAPGRITSAFIGARTPCDTVPAAASMTPREHAAAFRNLRVEFHGNAMHPPPYGQRTRTDVTPAWRMIVAPSGRFTNLSNRSSFPLTPSVSIHCLGFLHR